MKITTLTEQEQNDKQISDWGIWGKEVSKFDGYYDSAEHCLILEGKVTVKTDFETIEINA